MKPFLFSLLLTCIFYSRIDAQSRKFPQSWAGDWTGELSWYKSGTPQPQKIRMQLKIHPGDSLHTWTWHLIYGAGTKDSRPYTLIAKDSTGTKWVIDEGNGIVLDQVWLGERFCGTFSVQSSTILNSCWMENGKLVVEFYSYGTKASSTTGKGTEDSPTVENYTIGSYQKAILTRTK